MSSTLKVTVCKFKSFTNLSECIKLTVKLLVSKKLWPILITKLNICSHLKKTPQSVRVSFFFVSQKLIDTWLVQRQ